MNTVCWLIHYDSLSLFYGKTMTTMSQKWMLHNINYCFFMEWHQVAFILLFTSQLTTLNNYLCALDTTLRILITWYKLHVMNYSTRILCNYTQLAKVPHLGFLAQWLGMTRSEPLLQEADPSILNSTVWAWMEDKMVLIKKTSGIWLFFSHNLTIILLCSERDLNLGPSRILLSLKIAKLLLYPLSHHGRINIHYCCFYVILTLTY